MNGNTVVVQVLLDAGADLNAKTNVNPSRLHLAHTDTPRCYALLRTYSRCASRPCSILQFGNTALDVARVNRRSETVALLEAAQREAGRAVPAAEEVPRGSAGAASVDEPVVAAAVAVEVCPASPATIAAPSGGSGGGGGGDSSSGDDS